MEGHWLPLISSLLVRLNCNGALPINSSRNLMCWYRRSQHPSFSNNLHLLAAHCPQPSRVFINPYKLTNEDAEEIAVGTSVDHPFYKSINDYDHDYKIIRLRSFSSFSPIKLNNITTIPTLQQVLRLVGWGRFDPDLPEASETLQELNNDYIPNEKCNRGKFKGQITKDMLCARGSNSTGNSCKGDSGGPLIIPGRTSDEDVQVGIASWGRGGDCVYAGRCWNLVCVSCTLLYVATKSSKKYAHSMRLLFKLFHC